MKRLRLAAFAGSGLTALLALTWAAGALARVGGGQSFSGGGHSSYGNGNGFGGNGDGAGGDGDFIILLLELMIFHPMIGVPITVVAITFFVLSSRRSGGEGWSASSSFDPIGSNTPAYADEILGAVVPSVRQQLLRIRDFDPQFSLVLFEDFLYALYGEVQLARAAGTLSALSAYLSPTALQTIAEEQGRPQKVEGVIVGGLRFIEVSGLEADATRLAVRVRFEANYTETPAADPLRPADKPGPPKTIYAVEVWSLARSRTARSRPPEQTRIFKCPSCGAPLTGMVAGKCSYCGKDVATGDFDWLVQAVAVLEREERPPALFEDGTAAHAQLPTRTTPGAEERFLALRTRDPACTFEAFQARVELIFAELQAAWSDRDWSRARPFASDRLFQDWAHWIQLYTQEHVRNVILKPRITHIELCDAESDATFDTITVRLLASCIDYTVSESGRLLGGDKGAEKSFSEYWTLIRGSAAKGAPSAQKLCPQCGAELKINMAGLCEYCQAEVTSGRFDWVLSRIEQDEAYDG